MKRDRAGAYSIAVRPVVELACSTWIGTERLLRRHVLRGTMMLPPTEGATVGPVIVTITLPSRDVLTFDARIVRMHCNAVGQGIAMEIRFPELSASERRQLAGYTARLERGASSSSLPPFVAATERQSGMRWSGKREGGDAQDDPDET